MAGDDDLHVDDAAEVLIPGFWPITGTIVSLGNDEVEIRVPESLRRLVVPREDVRRSPHYRRDLGS